MRVLRYLLIGLIAVGVFTVGGVCAYFAYPTGDPDTVTTSHAVGIEPFGYKAEEILPGGDITVEVQMGENHMNLLENIINHMRYGLNATQKPILHNYLEQDGDIVYGDQQVSGGNLKHLMIDTAENADRLYFLVQRASATEYHVYTMIDDDLDVQVGTYITVYKSVVKKTNGKWDDELSYLGEAMVVAPGSKVYRAIDPATFRVKSPAKTNAVN